MQVDTESPNPSEGEISEQQPRDERTAVQQKTFTRWMNVFLQRCDPPVEVNDLFTDVQDGRILMALLEELSGCKLLYRFRASPHRIFRLNNIAKALAFLDDRHVKLLGIDASGIADGIPSVVLSLIWSVILFFQVKEASRGLHRRSSSSLSSLSSSSCPSSGDLSPQHEDIGNFSCSTLPSKSRQAARKPKYHGKAIKTLLQWVQRCTSKFGVEVYDFGKSWRSGLAFLALIKSVNPALVDLRESLSREPRENSQLAFTIAHHSLDIPPLLDPEDVSGTSPDERSVITYVSMFLRRYSGTDENRTRVVGVPHIPNVGSAESVRFGETLTEDPEVQDLLHGLERSSEQQLWKRWARRSSGSPRSSSLHGGDASSPFSQKKSRSRSFLQPPSPLDAAVISPEIRSWMEKGSVDQSKPRAHESRLSLSSEEGIYTVSALDSDEEDAYSYILELNKEDSQPYNQPKRHVPRVEEETEEEMLLNGERSEDSKHVEPFEMLNGGGFELQEGSDAQTVESEVGGRSVAHRTFDWDRNERSSRETPDKAAFDVQPEEDSREDREEETDVRGKSKCKRDKIEALIDETKATRPLKVTSLKKDAEDETDGGLFEKCGQVSEKRATREEKEEENVKTFEEVQDRNSGKENEDNRRDEETVNLQSVVILLSFKVRSREKVSIDEAAYEANGDAAAHTKEENAWKDDVPGMQDLTKDEDEERNSDDEVKNSVDSEAAEERDGEIKMKRLKLSEKKVTTTVRPAETPPKNDTNGGVNVHGGDCWTPARGASTPSFRAGGFVLQPPAVSGDVTCSELELLVLLWMLLYCCFVLPQMNL